MPNRVCGTLPACRVGLLALDFAGCIARRGLGSRFKPMEACYGAAAVFAATAELVAQSLCGAGQSPRKHNSQSALQLETRRRTARKINEISRIMRHCAESRRKETLWTKNSTSRFQVVLRHAGCRAPCLSGGRMLLFAQSCMRRKFPLTNTPII